MAIGVGAAVATWVGATGMAATVIAGAINGLIIGAVVGGLSAAVTGGDILHGVLFGAVGGAVTGGLGAYMSGASEVASTIGTVTENADMAANMTNVATGVSQTGEGIMSTAAGEVTKEVGKSAISEFLSKGGSEMIMKGVGGIAKSYMNSKAAEQAHKDAMEMADLKFEQDKEMLKLKDSLESKYRRSGGGGGGGGGGQNHDALTAAREKIAEGRRIRAEDRKNFSASATGNITKFKLNGGNATAVDTFSKEAMAEGGPVPEQQPVPAEAEMAPQSQDELKQAVPTS